jgi:trk system potassium uptake protein
MKIIIVGGGKLGNQIAHNMLDRKYSVKLIEKDKAKCMRLANDLDAEVIYGDGTEMQTLEEAGAKNADCFIAVTGSDQDNLVASQLAKKEYKIKKVIARNNDPRNLDALRKLGPDIAVSSTEIITNMIEQEVDSAQMHLLATLNRGKASINTLKTAGRYGTGGCTAARSDPAERFSDYFRCAGREIDYPKRFDFLSAK